jgi:hypothetical protein
MRSSDESMLGSANSTLSTKVEASSTLKIGTDPNYRFTYVWFNTIGHLIFHTVGVIGAVVGILFYSRILTTLYSKTCVFK